MEEARRHRGEALDLGGLVHGGHLRRLSGRWGSPVGRRRQLPAPTGFDLALLLAFTAFMVVGAVIVAHRPANAIGWLFSGIGLLTATGTLALDYAQYAYVTRPGSLPAAISR
jgi:hypothetical protein